MVPILPQVAIEAWPAQFEGILHLEISPGVVGISAVEAVVEDELLNDDAVDVVSAVEFDDYVPFGLEVVGLVDLAEAAGAEDRPAQILSQQLVPRHRLQTLPALLVPLQVLGIAEGVTHIIMKEGIAKQRSLNRQGAKLRIKYKGSVVAGVADGRVDGLPFDEGLVADVAVLGAAEVAVRCHEGSVPLALAEQMTSSLAQQLIALPQLLVLFPVLADQPVYHVELFL